MNTKGENKITRRNGAEIGPGALDQGRFNIHSLSARNITLARLRFDGASNDVANELEDQS